MKIQLLDMEIQIHFSLMQPLFQISKKLYGKSKPCNNLSTAFRQQSSQKDIRHIVQSTLVRNSNINIHLPLMIIRMHSQESQFHDKCLICSIKFIIYVQISSFCSAFSPVIHIHDQVQTVKSSVTVRRNMSNDVQNQSFGCFYHKSSIMFQPENSFCLKNCNGTQANSRERASRARGFLAVL